MAKKRTNAKASSTASVTAARAPRLYRLLKLLGERPQTRAAICKRLRLTVRGFYRDLELLRKVGIHVDLHQSTYLLHGTLTEVLDALPFPDPALTLGEAMLLAKGRSVAHRKIKAQIAAITGSRP